MRLIDADELLTVTDIREDGSEITYVLYDDIENAPTIERPECKWIPVSERLPTDDFGRFIITVESDDIYGAIDGILYPEVVGYYGGTWKDLGGKQIADEVISWMPLPETYKESEVGNENI